MLVENKLGDTVKVWMANVMVVDIKVPSFINYYKQIFKLLDNTDILLKYDSWNIFINEKNRLQAGFFSWIKML